MKKRILAIAIITVLVVATYLYLYKPVKTYQKDMYFMDTYINVKFYTNDSKLANKTLKEVETIYSTYHQLSDRFSAYPALNNVFYINNNTDKSLAIKLDSRLYNLIKYGIEWYDISGGVKNINIGNVVDVWKKYRTLGTGVPTLAELKGAGSIAITDIVLKADNYILNNHPNIDLGSIAKGYATEEVGKYLRSIGINKFLINAGGNVLVGDHYNNGVYKIGIQDPTSETGIFQIVKGNNIAVVTSGGYERYYEYNGVKYNHIIDPSTLFPAKDFKSVTVITNSSALGDSLSLILFVLPIEQGKAFIKNFDNVEAIWYKENNEIVKSDGFSKYE